MNKLITFLINLAIVSTPITAIYLYFKLTIPQVNITKSEVNASEYGKKVNEKLFTNYDLLIKSFEEPKGQEQKKGNLASLLGKYSLLGISAGKKENSKAIIKNNTTNKQMVLKIGGLLEGATLVDINFEQKFITFEKDGEQFRLEIMKPKPGTRVATISSNNPIPSASGEVSNINAALGKKSIWENKKPEEIIKIEKDQYTENLYYTDRASVEYIKENLYKLAGDMYVKPVFTDSGDKLLGIKVEQIKDVSVFRKVGLKPNDIITKVNETELSSIKEITKLFYSKELYEMKNLQFFILRDGKEQKIQIKVND